ncbi:MAG: hypothetical protein IJA32_09690 [Lachnospiraceae bacterium]|nr:hypothetical protein [Lachnospiraceae bacterium]
MDKEFYKVIKSLMLWSIVLVFLFFNGVIIYDYVGGLEARKELGEVHTVVLDYGVTLEKQGDVTNKNDDISAFYSEYVETYISMYDNLDMLDILEKKQKLSQGNLSETYAKFLVNNYEKLNQRVEEIKDSGEGNYGFYPGAVYYTHHILYGKVCKYLLVEMVILMVLAVLYLMDYERIHKTRDVVIATKIGKGVMQKKALAGLGSGFLFGGFLMAGTFFFFFQCVSFEGLWKVPVASSIMAEPRMQMIYPFITFWKLTEGEYFLCSIIVLLLVVLLAGGITIALQLLLQNSYFTFLVESLLYMALILVAFWNTMTIFDVVKNVLNPVCLWITCGGWFMENDVSLSFAGSEFICIAISAVLIGFGILLGKRRYERLEIK